MKQIFTRTSLVKHLYHETSATERVAVESALQEDFLLREKYEDLRRAYEQLPRVQFSPKPATLQKILQYSKRTALQQHS
jgi:hypothetical protein